MKSNINYLIILLGAAIGFYAELGEHPNTVGLVLSIIVIMVGVYRISKTIKSKTETEDEQKFVVTEEEEE